MKPPLTLSLSEWADKYRVLTSEASAEVGRWRTSRVEYMREIMDCATDPSVERVVCMMGVQLGKTELLLNVIGYYSHVDPAPIMFVQPNFDLGKTYMTTRIEPMIEGCPELKEAYSKKTTGKHANTLTQKSFTGGNLTIASAESATSLRGQPKRIILKDETSAYPASVGNEGDPRISANNRASNFWNRKIFDVSTPLLAGSCNIDEDYKASDQRTRHIPCPYCNHYHLLLDENLMYSGDEDGMVAMMKCPKCTKLFNNVQKNQAVNKGKWIKGNPSSKIAGFQLSTLYSPWVTLEELATERAAATASKDVEKIQSYYNNRLAIAFDDTKFYRQFGENELYNRREKYKHQAPKGVLYITCGVDVQKDRLECDVVGWGYNNETWDLDYSVIYGDIDLPETHEDSAFYHLNKYLSQTFTNHRRQELKIQATCIDSGGTDTNTTAVYRYVQRKKSKKIFAIKGQGGDKIDLTRKSKGNLDRKSGTKVDLYILAVDKLKDIVYRRLNTKEPGVNYCHFPYDRGEKYFEMLTAEVRKTKIIKGKPTRVWETPNGARNEALDCRVYALAAYLLMNPRLENYDKPNPQESTYKLEDSKAPPKLDEKNKTPQDTKNKRSTNKRPSKKTPTTKRPRRKRNDPWG